VTSVGGKQLGSTEARGAAHWQQTAGHAQAARQASSAGAGKLWGRCLQLIPTWCLVSLESFCAFSNVCSCCCRLCRQQCRPATVSVAYASVGSRGRVCVHDRLGMH
jgi:hypothetical protein